MIAAHDASLVYLDHGKQIYACRGVDLDVGEGEFVGILGPSGSGKSSLLFLLSGLKDPTFGDVTYRDASYKTLGDAERSQVRLTDFGFVFQQPYLLGYLSSLENVILVDPKSRDGRARALELLEKLGLEEKAHRLPSELSVGEKQRVCVARALFNQPAVVFADEPTASLDHKSGEQVVDLLHTHRTGALVMVTHDPTMLRNADRVLSIEEGVAREISDEGRRELHAG